MSASVAASLVTNGECRVVEPLSGNWHLAFGQVPAREAGNHQGASLWPTKGDVGRRREGDTCPVVGNDRQFTIGSQAVDDIRGVTGDVEIAVLIEGEAIRYVTWEFD